jgi:hypothetical protein
MTDQEFLEAFECGDLSEFHHRDHIRMAWLYLRQFGFEEGSKRIVLGIQHFAKAHHQTQLYHETITQFWIRLVRHAIGLYPETKDFGRLVENLPILCQSQSIYRHYTREALMSELARKEWCPPDILPLPNEF